MRKLVAVISVTIYGLIGYAFSALAEEKFQKLSVDFDSTELANLPSTGTVPMKRPDKRWMHLPHVEAEE